MAVLAHPGRLDSFAMLEDLVEAGLDGLEVNHPAHASHHKDLIRICGDRYELLLTGGSDFHGDYSEVSIALGRYLCPPRTVRHIIGQK